MKLALALGLIFHLASSLSPIQELASNDVKVKVEVYVESRCPFCKKFLTKSLNKAWQELGDTGTFES